MNYALRLPLNWGHFLLNHLLSPLPPPNILHHQSFSVSVALKAFWVPYNGQAMWGQSEKGVLVILRVCVWVVKPQRCVRGTLVILSLSVYVWGAGGNNRSLAVTPQKKEGGGSQSTQHTLWAGQCSRLETCVPWGTVG